EVTLGDVFRAVGGQAITVCWRLVGGEACTILRRIKLERLSRYEGAAASEPPQREQDQYQYLSFHSHVLPIGKMVNTHRAVSSHRASWPARDITSFLFAERAPARRTPAVPPASQNEWIVRTPHVPPAPQSAPA